MSRSSTLALNPTGSVEAWRLVQAINQMLRGKLNNVDDVTLRASQTTTTISDPTIGPSSIIILTPRSASAATALQSAYVSAQSQNSATITHPSNAAVDQNVRYCVLG